MKRKPNKPLPTHEQLVDMFEYDEIKGILIKKPLDIKYFKSQGRCDRYNKIFPGQVFGHVNTNHYLQGRIDKQMYLVHRLIWKWVTGEEPGESIDHLNGDTLDNRFENLRNTTMLINGKNSAKKSNNISGYTGVYWRSERSRWVAKVTFEGRKLQLGSFNSPEPAYKKILEWRKGKGYTDRHGI